MDLTRIRRALGRAWYLVVIALVFGAAGGYFLHSRAQPMYSATTHLVVGYADTGNQSGVTTDEQGRRALAAERATSLVTIAPTAPVVSAAMVRSKATGHAPQVTASGGGTDSLFTVTVTDADPVRAAAIANAYPDILLKQLEILVGQLDSSARLQTTAPATVPTEPIGTSAAAAMALGLAAGLAVGLIAALLVEILDSTIRESDEVSEITGLLGLGSVPHHRPRVRLPTHSEPRSVRSEAYRQIRTSITSMQPQLQVIAVTSATSSEGKTTVTCNVATTLARAGQRVLVIDADLRRSTVGSVMDVPPGQPGLTEVLQGSATLDEAVLVNTGPVPHVLVAGVAPADPSELLAGDRFVAMLTEVRSTYDYIFIDTPPVIPVTDALVVAPYVDGMILVARIGYSTPARLRRARAALDRVSAPMIGCVPNCAIGGADRDYRYGYGSYTGPDTMSTAAGDQPMRTSGGRRRKH